MADHEKISWVIALHFQHHECFTIHSHYTLLISHLITYRIEVILNMVLIFMHGFYHTRVSEAIDSTVIGMQSFYKSIKGGRGEQLSP